MAAKTIWRFYPERVWNPQRESGCDGSDLIERVKANPFIPMWELCLYSPLKRHRTKMYMNTHGWYLTKIGKVNYAPY